MAGSEMAPTEVFEVDPVALKEEMLLEDVKVVSATENAKVPGLSLTNSVEDGDEDEDNDDVRSPPKTPCTTAIATVPKQECRRDSTAAAPVVASSPRGPGSPCPAQVPEEGDKSAPNLDNTKNEDSRSDDKKDVRRQRSHSPFRNVLTNFQSGLRLMKHSQQHRLVDRKPEDVNGKDNTPTTPGDNNQTKCGEKDDNLHDNKPKAVERTKAEDDRTTLSEGHIPAIDSPLVPMKIYPKDVTDSVMISPGQKVVDEIDKILSPNETQSEPKEKETPSPSRFQSFVDNMLAKAKKQQQQQEEEGKESVSTKDNSSIHTDNAQDGSPKADHQTEAITAAVPTLIMPSLERKTEEQDPSTTTTITNSNKEGAKPLLGGFLSQAAKGLMNKRTSSSISIESASASGQSNKKEEEIIDDEVSALEEPSETVEKEEEESSAGLGGFLRVMGSTANLPTRNKTNSNDYEQELAHSLEEHTYSKPTNCDICSGLLVGLWSQGLQCKLCGMNVHRGEGIGGHDDCRAEALLRGCPGEHHCKDHNSDSPATKEPVRMREVIEQMRQLAKEKPNFLQEVKAQIDRDFSSQIKGIIVSKSTEEQKSKSLLRARNSIVPFIEQVDAMEPRGLMLIYSVLALAHVALAVLVGFIGWVGFILALWPKYGLLTTPALKLAHIHNMTVAYSFHVSVVLVVVLLRRLINLMNRKSNVLDHFLREVFKLEAEQDLGISVSGAAKRAQLWIRRVTNSSCVMCLVALMLWHSSQPPPTLFQPFAIA